MGSSSTNRDARVAVIVPVLDGERFLTETLRSLQAQTYTDWTCIVIDDGSTDATASIAESFAERDARFMVIRQAGTGTSAARNAGLIALAPDVEFVAFLDGDDLWLADALARLVDMLQRHPQAVGAYGNAEYMDAGSVPLHPGVHSGRQRDRRRMGRFDLESVPPEEPYTWSAMVVSGTLWPAAVALHRRAVVDRVGRFDPELRQLQDWDLYLRMTREGPFLPLDEQVAWYRQHDRNVTSRPGRVAFYTLMVRQRAWCASVDEPDRRREFTRVWRRLTLRWTYTTLQAGRRNGRMLASARDACTFARLCALGHPEPADERTAELLARYVFDPRPMAA